MVERRGRIRRTVPSTGRDAHSNARRSGDPVRRRVSRVRFDPGGPERHREADETPGARGRTTRRGHVGPSRRCCVVVDRRSSTRGRCADAVLPAGRAPRFPGRSGGLAVATNAGRRARVRNFPERARERQRDAAVRRGRRHQMNELPAWLARPLVRRRRSVDHQRDEPGGRRRSRKEETRSGSNGGTTKDGRRAPRGYPMGSRRPGPDEKPAVRPSSRLECLAPPHRSAAVRVAVPAHRPNDRRRRRPATVEGRDSVGERPFSGGQRFRQARRCRLVAYDLLNGHAGSSDSQRPGRDEAPVVSDSWERDHGGFV